MNNFRRIRLAMASLFVGVGIILTLTDGAALAQGKPIDKAKQKLAMSVAGTIVAQSSITTNDKAVEAFWNRHVKKYFDARAAHVIVARALYGVYTMDELRYLSEVMKSKIGRSVFQKSSLYKDVSGRDLRNVMASAVRCAPMKGRPKQLQKAGRHKATDRAKYCTIQK